MKKLLFVLFIGVLLSSCVTIYVNELPHYEKTFMMDFSEFAKKDFHFTTDIYRGKYISYGFISAKLFPEVKMISRMDEDVNYDENKYMKIDNWLIEKVVYKDILQKIYKQSTALGADAFVDFKIRSTKHPKYNSESGKVYHSNLFIYGDGFIISGLAIKRLD